MSKKVKLLITSAIFIIAVVLALLVFTVFIPQSKYNHAVSLMNNKNYEEAIVAFENISGYKDADAQIDEAKYLIAMSYMENKDYDKAIEALEKISGYKDADAQISEAKYLMALSYIENQDYIKAVETLKSIGGYKDSYTLLSNAQYLYAKLLLSENNYSAAYAILEELGDYSDAENLRLSTQISLAKEYYDAKEYDKAYELLKDLTDVGDAIQLLWAVNYERALIFFENKDYRSAHEILNVLGVYRDSPYYNKYCRYYIGIEEYNKGNYYDAGILFNDAQNVEDSGTYLLKCLAKEPSLLVLQQFSYTMGTSKGSLFSSKTPLDWWVVDSKDNKLLLVCKYSDQSYCYDNNGSTNWETCDLREWINTTYYESTFSEEEKKMIKPVKITSADGTVVTEDKVFILSEEEIEKYLTDKKLQRLLLPGWSYPSGNIDEFWVRTYGGSANVFAQRLYSVPGIREKDPNPFTMFPYVRPAIWISLD